MNSLVTNFDFDVIFIGAGPAGYNGAIRAAQLGLKTACIEKKYLGGTCLNVGCIPSKALLESSAKYELLNSKKLEDFGLSLEGAIKADQIKIMQKKDEIVGQLRAGIGALLKANGIEHIQGEASFVNKNEIIVKLDGGVTKTYTARNFVIASGSSPINLPDVKFDENIILSSEGALSLREVPKSMVVIGAGVIGLELGSVWNRYGCKVSVIEYTDKILGEMDVDLSGSMMKSLEKQGISFVLGSKVNKIEVKNNHAVLTYENVQNKQSQTIEVEKVLISIGRKPHTDGLNLSATGVMLDNRWRVITDHLKTNIDNIYAVGDVTTGPMLAHKAEEEGVIAAEMIAGQKPLMNHEFIPAVVYTHPEVASIGQTEEQLKAKNIKYNIGKASFAANGRAKTLRDTEGFVKLLCSEDNNIIYGAHILHSQAGTLINELAAYLAYSPCSPDDIALTCHSHPDLNEVIKAAALDVLGRPLAALPKKKK